MDMRKFSSGRFYRLEDVRDGPVTEAIAAVKMGKYDKPDLVFESGSMLSLNATNNAALVRAYGPNSDDWIEKEIELFQGEIEYQGKAQDAVLVRHVSPPLKPANRTKPKVPDFDDEIPDFK
jgi:hypothetical protein